MLREVTYLLHPQRLAFLLTSKTLPVTAKDFRIPKKKKVGPKDNFYSLL